MLAPANTAREILASEQLAARGFFTDVDAPGGGTLRLPGPFARLTAEDVDVAVRRRAPRLGEHTAEVLAEAGVDAAALARLRAEGAA
jgi:crotonobetainyl-CoA:carnitine CoA-transferase CaiB-like acyl-CoA transferase